jgi:hypothetical protein
LKSNVLGRCVFSVFCPAHIQRFDHLAFNYHVFNNRVVSRSRAPATGAGWQFPAARAAFHAPRSKHYFPCTTSLALLPKRHFPSAEDNKPKESIFKGPPAIHKLYNHSERQFKRTIATEVKFA